MAGVLLDMVAKTLGDFLMQRSKFLVGLGQNVEEIQSKLEEMENFLTIADNEKVRKFLSAAYECENILEFHAFKIESRKGRGCERILKRLAYIFFEVIDRQKIGPQLVKEKEKLSNILASFKDSPRDVPIQSQGQSSNAANFLHYRQTYPHQEVKPFVGMKDEFRELLRLLENEHKEAVISILGMGGIGKTALAKKMYTHFKENDTWRFEKHAWVTITQEYNFKNILKSILRQLGAESDTMEVDERDLVSSLNNVLTTRKCLVVLDDIWNEKQMGELSEPFPLSGAKSKILLTTRREEVAEKGFICRPSYLSEDESSELFDKKAFPQTDGAQGKPESLRWEIVRKCKNLPLAISKIAEILSSKEDIGDWEEVNRNFDTYLKGREGANPHEAVLHILGLSYEDLPYHLKLCFLYMGIFPEGAEVDVETLYLIWIAEGLVSPRKDQGINQTLFDIAEDRLMELAKRSLVEVRMKALPRNRYESCRLPSLMQDLCLQKCRKDEFLKVMEPGGSEPLKGDPRYATSKAYRLAIHKEAIKDPDSFIKKITQESTERVRCISLDMSVEKIIDMKQDKLQYLGNFIYLRILHLKGFPLEKNSMQKVLRKLIHLRFLSLKSCVLPELPSSIADLPFLEALDLRVSNEIIVPNVLCKIERLSHLFLGRLASSMSTNEDQKLQLDGLRFLETLEGFQPRYMKVEDIYKLTNLRVFSAEVRDNASLRSVLDLFHQLEEKCPKIWDTKLVVDGCDFITKPENGSDMLRNIFACPGLNRVRISGPLGSFYKSIEKGRKAMASKLYELELTGNTAFDNGSWAALECLENLRRLVLRSACFVKDEGQRKSEMVSHRRSFPLLTSFELIACDVNQWRIEEGAMPSLSSLVISRCSNLETIPEGLRFLPKLKTLTVCDMPPNFNRIDREVFNVSKFIVKGSSELVDGEPTQNQIKEAVNNVPLAGAEPTPDASSLPYGVEEAKNWIISLLWKPFHKVARYHDLDDVRTPLQILSQYPSLLTKKQAMQVGIWKSRIGDDPAKWQAWKKLSTQLDDAENKAKSSKLAAYQQSNNGLMEEAEKAMKIAEKFRSDLAALQAQWEVFGRIMRSEEYDYPRQIEEM